MTQKKKVLEHDLKSPNVQFDPRMTKAAYILKEMLSALGNKKGDTTYVPPFNIGRGLRP